MTHSAALDDLLAHAAWARSLARRLVEDQAAADDVVQDLWVAALRRPPATDRPLKPWIAGVVRRLAGRRRRTATRRHERERAAAQPEALAPADEPVARAEAQRMLVDEVLALDEPLRTTVLQRYFDGLEPAEIAAATGVPAGTVRWRLSAAREQLRQRLDARHGDDRRAWAQALIPFAALGVPRQAVLLTPTLGAGALGGLLTMKMFWNAAALVLVAMLAWVGWNTVASVRPTTVPADAERGAALAAQDVDRASTEAAEPPPVRRTIAEGRPSRPSVTPTDAAAETAATIRLRCVDEAGSPIPDVHVRALHYARGPRDGTLGRSEPDGVIRATLRDHPRSLVGATLELSRSGFATTTLSTNLQPDAVVDLGDVVVAAGAWIRGRVVDRQGSGLRDVEVRTDGRSRRMQVGPGLFADTEDGSGKVATRTDAEGRFELSGVVLGSQELVAELGNEDEETWMLGKVGITVPAAGLPDVRVVVEPPANAEDAIRITVVDPEGAPVGHADVRLESARGVASSSADREGRQLFRPRHTGPFTLVAAHPANLYLPVRVEGVELGDRVELRFVPVRRADVRFVFARTPSPEQVALEITTPPTRGMFGGLFGGGGSGDPVGDEQVRVEPGADRGSFRVPDAPFVITASATGHLPATTGTLDPDNLPEPLTITFEAARQVYGRVVDADGDPLAGAEVDLFLRSEGRTTVNGFPVWIDRSHEDSTRTDTDGRYRLDWIPDRIGRVRVSADSGRLCCESADLHPDTGDLECDLVARRPGALEGNLFGTPGPAGTVVACSRGDGLARTTRADAEGRYRFDGLLPGDYRVTLRDDEIDPRGWSSHTGFGSPHQSVPTDCVVLAGETTIFDLRDGALGQAFLKTRIVIPGRDLAGAALEVFDATAGFGANPRSNGRALLDAEGNALLRGLGTGPHRIITRHQGILFDARVDLRDGENRLDVVVEETGSVKLTGLPPGPSREFADGVVFVTCELPNAVLHFPVLGEGEVSLADLPAGPARLERSSTRDEMRAAMQAGHANPLELLIPLRRFTIPADGEIRVAW